jgi:hypothetical protein
MSSASSIPASAAKYPSWLYEALSSVAESSFCASAEACDEATFAELAASMAPWLEARVQFNGGMRGEVICTVPESLVRELAAVFTGADPDDPIEATLVDDLMGEFANMVCGRWLTRVSDQSPFDLAAPIVTRTEIPVSGGSMPSLVNGKPAMFRVVVTGW